MGNSGIKSAYLTGKGSILIRGKTSIENTKKNKESIIISEVPFAIKKSQLIENIAKVARDKIIDGISELRDESNREGVRVVIELKRDVQSEVVLNQLFKFTSLQTSYGINMLALNKGVPELLNLKRSIQIFIDFRKDVIFKRTKFHLRKQGKKAHILLGLSIALENIDKVIDIIKSSNDTNDAKEKLIGFKWKIPSDKFLLDFIKSDNHELISENYFKLSESQV